MNKDIIRLRELAKQVREIAEDPVQELHRKLWTAVNDKKMIQPVAMARDYGLDMVDYEDELTFQIEDKELKYYEAHLLAIIYQWKHLRCHTITEKRILCDVVTEETPCGLVDFKIYCEEDFWRWNTNAKAKHFYPVFKDMDDVKKIVPINIKYDKEATKKKVDRITEIFDGILPVYPRGHSTLLCSPYDDIFRSVGLEEGMIALMDEPEFIKAMMERLIDLFIDHQKKVEGLGLLNYNTGSALTGKGGYGCTTLLPQVAPDKGVMGAKTKESWGFLTDQIFTSVSPETSNEFAFEMEKRYAENFGLLYYGCCEKLENKIDGVLSLPNIHKISCSPYSITEAFFEKVGDKAVISLKPNSLMLAQTAWDKEAVKQELINACKYARKYNCHLEAIMKTMINIGKGPSRLWEWCEMAVEVFNNY